MLIERFIIRAVNPALKTEYWWNGRKWLDHARRSRYSDFRFAKETYFRLEKQYPTMELYLEYETTTN